MFNPTSSIRIFSLLELLGFVLLVTGLIIAVVASFSGEWWLMPYGLSIFLGSLAALAVTHAGHCLVDIADTSSEILSKINGAADPNP